MNHRPHIHRATTVRLHGSPGEAISLDDYIDGEREQISAGQLRELSGFSAQLLGKMTTEQARQHHDLQVNTNLIVRILASEAVQSSRDPLPAHLAELGVAAHYLLKGMDLIPDSLPEIGLTDDARLVARVFDRNPVLHQIAGASPTQ